jgi:cyclopropane fatty-acyl-phospholipid synthase-like methyltransferase
MCRPTLDEAVEWRVPIWAPAVESALQRAAVLVPSDANVLEVGYNTGMMACYMARHYGWNLVGYDISEALRIKATKTAKSYGLEDKTDFRVCLPDETLLIEGNYDAVFLKSVLYHISDKSV